MRDPEPVHDVIHPRALLRVGHALGQAQARGEEERLVHGEHRREHVLLGHEPDPRRAVARAGERDAPEHLAGLVLLREDLDERRLAGPAGPEDGHHLARDDAPADGVEDDLALLRVWSAASAESEAGGRVGDEVADVRPCDGDSAIALRAPRALLAGTTLCEPSEEEEQQCEPDEAADNCKASDDTPAERRTAAARSFSAG